MHYLSKSFLLVAVLCFCSCGDSNPPTIVINTPVDGDVFTIGDTLRLSGNVSDDILIDSVTFFTESLFEGSVDLATVSDSMDIDFFTEFIIDSLVVKQNYRLEAKAYDNEENETKTSVDFSVR